MTTGEALMCSNYSVIGQVQLQNLESLVGYLTLDQIPDAIITGAKIATETITNSKIAPGAAIDESKLNLDQSTSDLLLAATYLAHDHSPADPTQIDHSNLLNVLASQHHVKTTSISELTDHNKANHDSLNINADTLDTKHYSDIASEIDSDISTHAGIAGAHHVKTTSIADLTDHNKANHDSLNINADTLDTKHYSDISSEIDSDISTHAGNANAHHNQSHSLASHSDVSVTGTELDNHLDTGKTHYTRIGVSDFQGNGGLICDGSKGFPVNLNSWISVVFSVPAFRVVGRYVKVTNISFTYETQTSGAYITAHELRTIDGDSMTPNDIEIHSSDLGNGSTGTTTHNFTTDFTLSVTYDMIYALFRMAGCVATTDVKIGSLEVQWEWAT